MTPVYKHGGLTVYHGDCLSLDIEPVDAMITDPPFAPKTHSNARTNKGGQKGGSSSWECVPWKAKGGYGSQRADGANDNAKRERIWFSPHCLGGKQRTLF